MIRTRLAQPGIGTTRITPRRIHSAITRCTSGRWEPASSAAKSGKRLFDVSLGRVRRAAIASRGVKNSMVPPPSFIKSSMIERVVQCDHH
jgi:hypothetical protein